MFQFLIATGFERVLPTYFLGVFGAITIEFAAVLRDVAENSGRSPPLYRKWSYVTLRLLFAFVAAGPLAVIFTSGESPWSAFYVGATAPLVFDRVASGIPSEADNKSRPRRMKR